MHHRHLPLPSSRVPNLIAGRGEQQSQSLPPRFYDSLLPFSPIFSGVFPHARRTGDGGRGGRNGHNSLARLPHIFLSGHFFREGEGENNVHSSDISRSWDVQQWKQKKKCRDTGDKSSFRDLKLCTGRSKGVPRTKNER